MTEALEVPVAVLNDAHAAALGEWALAGPGRRRPRQGPRGQPRGRWLVVTLGTGVGGSLIGPDGAVEQGRTGRGGQFGHTLFRYDGRPCPCGRRGCVEAYVSGSAVAQRASERLGRPFADFAAVVRAAEDHPDAPDGAAAFLRRVGAEIGHAVTGWDMVFECDRYVFTGGMMAGARWFWPATLETVEGLGRVRPGRVRMSRFGDRATLWGARTYWLHRYGRGGT